MGPRLDLFGDEGADVGILGQLELGQQVVLTRGRVNLAHICDIIDQIGRNIVGIAQLAFDEDENGSHHGRNLPFRWRCIADGNGMGKAPVTQSPPAVDFEADYNNRQRVPEHPDIIKKWREDSLRVMDARRPETFEYGTGERQKLEWFDAGEDKPTAIFVHGGYWQALDRGWFSWVAPALQDQGINVAIPGYDLTPNVRLGQSIDCVRRATEWVRQKTGKRPLIFGHSAGGHMASAMLSEGRARAALSLSGVFDLEPLIQTSLNEALRLDVFSAKAMSPVYWPAPSGGAPGGRILDCWVGGAESNEFLRQSRNMAATWGGLGAETRVEVVEGANHFSILEGLANPQSALVQRLVALSRQD